MKSSRSRARRQRRRWPKTASRVMSQEDADDRPSVMSVIQSQSGLSVDGRENQQIIVAHSAQAQKQLDYTKEDPPFLDEFDSSVEVVVRELAEEVEHEEEVKAGSDVSSDVDQFAVYEKPEYCSSSTDIYDQICDGIDVESDDSCHRPPFKYTKRRKGKNDEERVICEEGKKFGPDDFLNKDLSDALIRGLAEVALYQPSNPVEYLTKFLIHSSKTPSELGLDPDPRLIQELIDRQKAPRPSKKSEREPIVFAEDDIMSFVDKINQAMELGDTSELEVIKNKFFSAKEAFNDKTREEKERLKGNIKADSKCLGPTTLVGGHLPREKK